MEKKNNNMNIKIQNNTTTPHQLNMKKKKIISQKNKWLFILPLILIMTCISLYVFLEFSQTKHFLEHNILLLNDQTIFGAFVFFSVYFFLISECLFFMFTTEQEDVTDRTKKSDHISMLFYCITAIAVIAFIVIPVCTYYYNVWKLLDNGNQYVIYKTGQEISDLWIDVYKWFVKEELHHCDLSCFQSSMQQVQVEYSQLVSIRCNEPGVTVNEFQYNVYYDLHACSVSINLNHQPLLSFEEFLVLFKKQ